MPRISASLRGVLGHLNVLGTCVGLARRVVVHEDHVRRAWRRAAELSR